MAALDESLARVSDDFLNFQYQMLGILESMQSPDVTEICINRPGELYLERRREFEQEAEMVKPRCYSKTEMC